ncbi:MAG: AAA family ATPase [Gemmatimonadota bacterium]|nr:AAA family ATPase [Gemmatimonadota bacterium]
MRLRSLKVRNYRVHRDLEVRFDDRLNLVAGPNEVGKSTVAEALHRALFLRPNVTGAVREGLLTRPDGGHPEVEVVFAADGAEWTLHKRFSGGNGTVRLSRHGETTLSGDEAEARLAELLRGEDALGGRRAGQLDDKWAHLWVWQGASGGDPAGSLQAQADQLIQRLQSMGGLGLYVSQRDSEVAGRVRARYEEVFTKAGKPRAGSELHEREEAAAAAQARLEERTAAVRELEGAAERYRDAGARLEKAREALASLEEEEARVAERLREVERLRREQEERTRKLTETRERLERLREADREIAELVEAIAARREDVATQETAFEALEADHAERLEARARAERLREDAARAVREARVELERRRARLQHAERREQLAELESVRERVEALEEEIDEATRALSELPPVTDEVLEELAALDAERLRSEDRLSAVAAEIEVLEAGLPVRLADEPIEPETPRTVTRDTELRVGEETRIRIRPGGGETLEETRALAEERAATLAGRLEELGCASLAKARETSKERVKLESARDGARAKLEGLAGEDFDARLRRAQEQWQEAQGALARFGEELPGDEAEPPAPETLAAGVEEAERVLAEREETERRLEEERSEKARAVEQASGTLEEKREALRSVKAEVDRKKSNLELLEERVGDAERRRQELEGLAEREAREAEQLAETEAALAGLDPDQLEADRTRLVRALEQQRSERSEADRERAGARALLESGGTTDPYADLKAAHAALDRARERERSARLRADALALLHETFETEKGALTRSLVAPLEERVNGYLRTIFADGSEIALDLEGTSLATPSLRRGERFAFEELSGGAREQFAVAVRLAAAELLAEDHDGALPIVLDDAFAYSDPERVRGLMRALDRAAGRGLQVVLMTCTPEDYASLGAHSIHLTRAPAG